MIAPVTVALYSSNTDPVPVVDTLSWADLVSVLTEVTHTPCDPCPGKTCAHKFGAAWSPVTIVSGATRSNAAVRTVTAAVLDLDHLTQADVERVAGDLTGLAYILHTTHSHRPAPTPARPGGDWCLRLVLPLTRPVAAAEYPRFLSALVAMSGLPADPATKDLSRLFFLPSVAAGGEFLADAGEGEPIDVDAVLGKAPVAAPPDPAPVPAPDDLPEDDAPDAPVDLASLQGYVKEMRTIYRRRKDVRADLLHRILEGEALAVSGARDHTLHQAASILATKLPANTPPDAAVEILRRSIGAMDVEPEGLAHWLDLARSNFVRMHAARLDRDAKAAAQNATLRASLRRLAAARAHKPAPAADAAAPAAADPEDDSDEGADLPPAPPEDPDAWARRLRMRPPKEDGADPTYVPCAFNARLLLAYSPEWKGHIRFNDVRKEVEVIDLPGKPAPIPVAERHMDVLPSAVCNWLMENCDMNLNEGVVASQLLLVARSNVYDPVLEYLTGVMPKWDGQNRLEDFFVRYCGAQATNASGRDISAHLRRVSAKWLISAAARGIRPGCKVDTLIILESPQGRKKSSLFEVLGGDFYAVARVDVEQRDSLMVLARSWIVELAELSALRNANDEKSRAFFSTKTDLYRLPYGKAVSEVPRRCVFAGTTNPTGDGYLSDRTGNRRYWPIEITEIDLAAVKQDRDQIFAEAAVRASRVFAAQDAGLPVPAEDRWWLEGDEAEEAEEQASERLSEDSLSDQIYRKWLDTDPDKRPLTLTALDVATNYLNGTIEKLDRKMETRIGIAMRDLQFRRERISHHGRRMWGYVSTEELRALPKVAYNAPRSPVALLATKKDGSLGVSQVIA